MLITCEGDKLDKEKCEYFAHIETKIERKSYI